MLSWRALGSTLKPRRTTRSSHPWSGSAAANASARWARPPGARSRGATGSGPGAGLTTGLGARLNAGSGSGRATAAARAAAAKRGAPAGANATADVARTLRAVRSVVDGREDRGSAEARADRCAAGPRADRGVADTRADRGAAGGLGPPPKRGASFPPAGPETRRGARPGRAGRGSWRGCAASRRDAALRAAWVSARGFNAARPRACGRRADARTSSVDWPRSPRPSG